MSVFSYHLIKLPFISALKMVFSPIKSKQVNGLIYAETMSAMVLGSPIFSYSRFFNREIVVSLNGKTKGISMNSYNLIPKENKSQKAGTSGSNIYDNGARFRGFKFPNTTPHWKMKLTPWWLSPWHE